MQGCTQIDLDCEFLYPHVLTIMITAKHYFANMAAISVAMIDRNDDVHGGGVRIVARITVN
jgi:hypothetical protein